MSELSVTKQCTTLAAVAEYRAAGQAFEDEAPALQTVQSLGLKGAALESFMREWGFKACEHDRWAGAIRRIPELAYASEDPVSRDGAIAALKLATDPEQDAIGLRACQALAALALRYLTASRDGASRI